MPTLVKSFTLSFTTGSRRIYYIFGERMSLTAEHVDATRFETREAAEKQAAALKRKDIRIKTIDVLSIEEKG